MAIDTPLIEHPCEGLAKKFLQESKRLWRLTSPIIVALISPYSIYAITQLFCGHLPSIDLAAFAVQNTVINRLSFGVMLSMSSALKTLCGQAFGSGRKAMLGVYMQRSLIIMLATACCLIPLFVFASPVLQFFGETAEISDATARVFLLMIPQVFTYAINFPMQKFLQAQRNVLIVATFSAATLPIHALLSWLVIFKLDCGLVGAAVTLNVSFYTVYTSNS